MRVLILGGSGLIGRSLASKLAADGHEVIILSRSPEGRGTWLPAGARIAGWDGKSAGEWAGWIDRSTAIVNLAGENLAGGRWTAERKRRLISSRVDPGRALVAALRAAPERPLVVIQGSAIGYYGARQSGDLTEGSAPGDDFAARVCAEWEASTAEVEGMGVRRAVIRTAVVLDRNLGALPRMLLPFRLFIGGPLGGGRQPFSWIHLQDEVAAIRFLLQNDQASGAFNLCSPAPLTNAEFSRAIGRVMHRPAVVPTPAFALRLVFGEMASTLLTGQRVLPRRLLELGFTFRFPAADDALRDILG